MSTNWLDSAACIGIDADMFFVDCKSKRNQETVKFVLGICQNCPVRETCLEANFNEEFGIWGGKTPEERKAMRRHPQHRRSAQS